MEAGDGRLKIPVLSTSLARLVTLPADLPEYYDEVLATTSGDPGLTCRGMNIANSAAYRGDADCQSLDEALMRIGARRFVALLLESHMLNVFVPSSPEMHAYWKHSMTVGAACRHVAKKFRIADLKPEQAFMMGLFHNIGGLVMAYNDPDGYRALLQDCDVDSGDLRKQERATYGRDHQAVGQEVASQWKLPEAIAEVIENHHAGERLGGLENPDVVALTWMGLALEHRIRSTEEEVEAADAGVLEASRALDRDDWDATFVARLAGQVEEEAQPDIARLGSPVAA